MSSPFSKPDGPSIACLLSGILGNRAFSTKLADAVDAEVGTQTTRYWFDAGSYAAHPAPRLFRLASEAEAAYVARRFFESIDREHDLYIINGHAIAQGVVPALRRRFPRSRIIVALDATPAAFYRFSNPGGKSLRTFARSLVRSRQHRNFATMTRDVTAWLPICPWVRDSLVTDYHVPAPDCFVTNIPQALPAEPSAVRNAHMPLRLLFVGNDFERKGGDLLLDLVRQSAGTVTLTIVSNDPAAHGADRIPGVQLKQGLTSASEVASHYREADLLALPTAMDCYPNVICEGLAYGLPFIATGINGINDQIAASNAGLPIPWPPNLDSLKAAVADVATNPDLLPRLSRNANHYARTALGFEALRQAVGQAIGRCNGSR